MKDIFTEKWRKAAMIRAIKTTAQTLVAQLPTGFIITPIMLKETDITVIYIIGAWLITGVLAGFASILTSIAGLPEVKEGE